MSEIYIYILVLFNVILAGGLIVLQVRSGKRFGKIIEEKLASNRELIREEINRMREDNLRTGKDQREELRNSIKFFGDQLTGMMNTLGKHQKSNLSEFSQQLDKLTVTLEKRSEKLEEKVSAGLTEIRENNAVKLEEMRKTVDEKLHETLEKRLGNSFKLVSERLEMVHKGLGEMQNLANGVGDLKKVLTNVKARGTWGEIQLQNIIEHVLAPSQYEKNVKIKPGTQESVEFAIKLPGRNDNDETVYLPIDAKFPMEDYQRLLEARESGNTENIEVYYKGIETRIKAEAKSISAKYIAPPKTTDFAILFIPVEGLYAEILSRPGLAENLQKDYRVIISGPTNLTALLNSLQMGFRTLAIEKRSGEVWKLLGAIKSEFSKFGAILEKTQLKLDQASRTIGDATKKTRTIERKLNDVEALPENESVKYLDETM